MELNNLKLLATQNININLDSFIFSILLSIILSFLVQKFYIKFSTTLSNKVEFSKTFIISSLTPILDITWS